SADPAAAVEAAHTAVKHLRAAGARDLLATAIINLAQALLLRGEWDAAGQQLTEAVEADGLADSDYLTCYRAWLAALRGDAPTADTILAGLGDMRVSEDVQDKSLVAVVEAFTAAARLQH